MSVQTLQNIYSQCRLYLRKPGLFQIGKGLHQSNFFIFFSQNDVNVRVIMIIYIIATYRFYFTFSLINFYYRKLTSVSTSIQAQLDFISNSFIICKFVNKKRINKQINKSLIHVKSGENSGFLFSWNVCYWHRYQHLSHLFGNMGQALKERCLRKSLSRNVFILFHHK